MANSQPQQPVIVGFDTETPVVWGQRPDGSSVATNQRVALMQLCYHPQSSDWVS